MKKKSFLLIVSAVFITAAAAVYFWYSNPPADKALLTFQEVKAKGIQGLMDYYEIPGFAYCVVKGSKVEAMDALGCIKEGSDVKITTKNYFLIGSVTKSFTGLIAAKLVEEGKINWDTRFFDLYPDWKNGSKSDYHDITLKDLLSNRARIQPFEINHAKIDSSTNKMVYTDMPNFSGSPTDRRLNFCRYVLTLPPMDAKGFSYSNAGFSLAGIMLEKASGKSYEELAVEIGKAVGMNIQFSRPNNIDGNQPWGNKIGTRGRLIPVPPDDPYPFDDIFAPAGKVAATIEDMSKYVSVYLQGLSGKDGYISSESCKYLLSELPDYSMGWYNVTDGETYYYHNGTEGSFTAQAMIFKELNSSIVIMLNMGSCKNVDHFIDDLRNYLKDKYIR